MFSEQLNETDRSWDFSFSFESKSFLHNKKLELFNIYGNLISFFSVQINILIIQLSK